MKPLAAKESLLALEIGVSGLAARAGMTDGWSCSGSVTGIRSEDWQVDGLWPAAQWLRVSTEQFPIETKYGEMGIVVAIWGPQLQSRVWMCRSAMWSVAQIRMLFSMHTVETRDTGTTGYTHWTRVLMHDICAALCAACDSPVARQSQRRTGHPQHTLLVTLAQANTWRLQNVKANAGHSLACLKKTLSLICFAIPRPNATVLDTGKNQMRGQA